MSRRRRNEMPPSETPGDGQPYPPPGGGRPMGHQAAGDEPGYFGPRPPEPGGPGYPAPGPYGAGGPYPGPAERDPYGAERDPYGSGSYDSPSYVQGGPFFGRQGGGLAGPANGPGHGTPGPGQGQGAGGPGQGPGGQGRGRGADVLGQGAGGQGRGPGGNGPMGPRSGGPGGPDGRPEPPASGGGRRRVQRRRSLGALIGPLAGAIGLAILLGAGVYALADSSKCGGTPIDLKVAAAPDIAPAISDIATSFNNERHAVGGKCVKATVKSSDPASTSTIVSGQSAVPGDVTPDVWIPDSSLWLTLVRSSPKGAASVNTTPTSVAETPLVVATTRTFANKIRGQGVRPTWDMLLKATDALAAGAVSKNDMLPADSVHLQILDPTRTAGGLGAVVMTRMLLQGDPNANAIFTQITRKVQNSISPNNQALFASFHRNLHGRAPVVIAPEQAVWKYNQGKSAAPASAIYPNEGMLSLDHPFALTTNDDTKLRAAALLEKAMNSEQAHAAVHALGFRTPDGRAGTEFGSASGLSPRIPRALPTPSSGDVTDVMQAWTKLSLRTRMLTLLDVSGSMVQPVGKGVTRMEATAQVAQGGLAILPDDTDLGLWTFSTKLQGSQDYRTEVPIGPLSTRLGSGTRRQAILSALGRVRPKPDGDTGLYDSVLAAFRSMKNSYKPGYYNTVLVLTDGKNDDANGISLSNLLRTLKKENDPNEPVMVLFIGFGPDVDMASMQKIAAETDGAAYQAMKPQEIQRIFLNTVARRICAPDCH
ncbi:substrate-binding and VWA domain-containing protein [Actinoallomurus purpureus]|uniref:substrate-binding domain-containing protein n=1 Tax=Actinoallomurus purpureus TaxID=478114 RepID=UPI0020932C2C|nr:substrate-binding domain-containing protein [Actinoallomurus purpureus]MCO6007045.1 substrate-binding and VWA domain-containing protein [Actinoallomurus purpureus]